MQLINMVASATPQQKKILKWITAGVILTMFLCIFLASTVTVQADAFESVKNGFLDLYKKIGYVVTALAVVCLGLSAFKWLLGGSSEQEKLQAKKWFISIIIGLCVYWGAFVIVNTVQNLMMDAGVDTQLNVPWSNMPEADLE